MKLVDFEGLKHLASKIKSALALKADKTYVDEELSNISPYTAGDNISIDGEEINVDVGKNSMSRALLHYGYPVAINEAWDVDKAVELYRQYNLVVFGEGYQKKAHKTHKDTVKIIQELSHKAPKTKVYGYVGIGALNKDNTVERIKRTILEWADIGADGMLLDEFGYDYLVTRDRQNEVVEFCHDQGLNVIANTWNYLHAFSSEDMYLDWLDFEGNPNLLDPKLGENDHVMFESMFYYVEDGVQRASNSERVVAAHEYNDKVVEGWGMSYREKYGTNTFFLDGLVPGSQDYYNIGYIGSQTLNADIYGASIPMWGAGTSNVTHYSTPKVDRFASVGRTIIGDLGEEESTVFDNRLGEDTIRLIWAEGEDANDPEQGVREAYIGGRPLRSRGKTSQRPTQPFTGLTYYDTDIDRSMVFDGTNWKSSGIDEEELKKTKVDQALSADKFRIKDLKDNKEYSLKLQISKDNKPQIAYREEIK